MEINRRIAVVGGGISGLAVARMLRDRYAVTLYEADARPGGLVKCDRVAEASSTAPADTCSTRSART